jgi:hypothetical protein
VKLSPALIERITAIDGCQGNWLIDNRVCDGDYSFAMRNLGESFVCPDGSYHSAKTALAAAELCAQFKWRGPRLLWQSDYLDADCSWPGGCSAPSVYQSNNRVFCDDFKRELAAGADADGPGLSLDLRYITADMVEVLLGLESYPLISEDDLSSLECDLQDEAWHSWGQRDWQDAVTAALQTYAPDTANAYWAEEQLDTVPDLDSKLRDLFHSCSEQTNTYWFEDGTEQWVDIKRVATGLDLGDLTDLTGLPLLPLGQEWRRLPYPWPDGTTSPLVAPLPG